jgi:hypothetical protein
VPEQVTVAVATPGTQPLSEPLAEPLSEPLAEPQLEAQQFLSFVVLITPRPPLFSSLLSERWSKRLEEGDC